MKPCRYRVSFIVWTMTGRLPNRPLKKATSFAKKPVLTLTVSTALSASTLPSLPISQHWTVSSEFLLVE